jgi:hypothetical protein
MTLSSSFTHERPAIVVWLDHWHALIARSQLGQRAVTVVEREAEPEEEYLRRVAQATSDCDRLVILGPDDERLAFDREYEELYAPSDRFIEVDACVTATPNELLDRLRFLDGSWLLPPGW